MHRLALLLVLVGCRGDDKHVLPKVTLADAPPTPPKLDTKAVEARVKEMFPATQKPDIAAQIAKLEASRASLPEGERKLIDRSIALIKVGERVETEPDKAKQRELQIQLVRDTVSLYEDMAAVAPDDLETNAKVAGSLQLTADQIESLGIADVISPRSVKQKARAIAERMIKVHATSSRAWALHADVTPYSEPELRLRSFARCVKLEPSNAACKKYLDDERVRYVRPYCEGAERRPVKLEWRAVSQTPIPGGSTVDYHYETYYVDPTVTFSWNDVVRVRSDETRTTTHQADGKVVEETWPSVRFELAPGKQDAMLAWSRALEARSAGYALFLDGKLQFIERRAQWEDSNPGISNLKIEEVCARTKQRVLPALE